MARENRFIAGVSVWLLMRVSALQRFSRRPITIDRRRAKKQAWQEQRCDALSPLPEQDEVNANG